MSTYIFPQIFLALLFWNHYYSKSYSYTSDSLKVSRLCVGQPSDLTEFFQCTGLHCDSTQWFQTAKTCPKIYSLKVISRIFPSKFQKIDLISVSGHCMHFILKICQTVLDISMTSQFHEFLNSIFGVILLFGPTVWRAND